MKLKTGVSGTFTGIYYDYPNGSAMESFFQFDAGGAWIFRQYAQAELTANRDVREVLSLGPEEQGSLLKGPKQYRLTVRGTLIDYVTEANPLFIKERWILRIDELISLQQK